MIFCKKTALFFCGIMGLSIATGQLMPAECHAFRAKPIHQNTSEEVKLDQSKPTAMHCLGRKNDIKGIHLLPPEGTEDAFYHTKKIPIDSYVSRNALNIMSKNTSKINTKFKKFIARLANSNPNGILLNNTIASATQSLLSRLPVDSLGAVADFDYQNFFTTLGLSIKNVLLSVFPLLPIPKFQGIVQHFGNLLDAPTLLTDIATFAYSPNNVPWANLPSLAAIGTFALFLQNYPNLFLEEMLKDLETFAYYPLGKDLFLDYLAMRLFALAQHYGGLQKNATHSGVGNGPYTWRSAIQKANVFSDDQIAPDPTPLPVPLSHAL